MHCARRPFALLLPGPIAPMEQNELPHIRAGIWMRSAGRVGGRVHGSAVHGSRPRTSVTWYDHLGAVGSTP